MSNSDLPPSANGGCSIVLVDAERVRDADAANLRFLQELLAALPADVVLEAAATTLTAESHVVGSNEQVLREHAFAPIAAIHDILDKVNRSPYPAAVRVQQVAYDAVNAQRRASVAEEELRAIDAALAEAPVRQDNDGIPRVDRIRKLKRMISMADMLAGPVGLVLTKDGVAIEPGAVPGRRTPPLTTAMLEEAKAAFEAERADWSRQWANDTVLAMRRQPAGSDLGPTMTVEGVGRDVDLGPTLPAADVRLRQELESYANAIDDVTIADWLRSKSKYSSDIMRLAYDVLRAAMKDDLAKSAGIDALKAAAADDGK